MYPTWDATGDIKAPTSSSQFEDLYNHVKELLSKVDGDKTKQLPLTSSITFCQYLPT
jgi:hypothetical protein